MHNAMRAAREKAGLTQYGLAKKCGLGQSVISAWEKGRNSPTAYNLVLVCDVLHISIDEYIGRKNAVQR